jgi:hypothetical protein
MSSELRVCRCKNRVCNWEIGVPGSMLLQKSAHQTLLSTGKPCTGIVCPGCKHAYGYTAEELQPLWNDDPDPFVNPPCACWIAIEVECDGGDCQANVQLLAQVQPILHADGEWYFAGVSLDAQEWQPHDLRCLGGFPISNPPRTSVLL